MESRWHPVRGVSGIPSFGASLRRLCIVSTYRTFARKDTRLDTISSLVFLFCVGMMPEMGCCSNFFRYIEFCGGREHCRIGNWGGNRERLSFME